MIWQYLLLFFFVRPTTAQVEPSTGEVDPIKWPTLSGKAPVVVARGGYSGLFPDSSEMSVRLALNTSFPVVLYCDLQLTKDELGICQPNLRIDNTTNAPYLFPDSKKTYDVYGDEISGWFALDFELPVLSNLSLLQNILTRPGYFDGLSTIRTPDDFIALNPTNSFWLNVEYDMFYNQNKVSAARYIQDSAKIWTPDYLSSPEIAFLKKMSRKIDKKRTKLIFKFKAPDIVEPTTKETYHSLLDKLSMVKSFASGILVPKYFIWPTDDKNYLLPKTTLVSDSHKQGLEVYAYGFESDVILSYNYSSDPVKEYLNFVGATDFAVDGVITDYPSTASSAVECFAQRDLTKRKQRGLVISHNGASGDYPSNTNLAYQLAIDVGVDVIDCPVQMSKDGVPFCCGYPDLQKVTNAFKKFADRARVVPEITDSSGIYAFDLTWEEITTLKSVTKVLNDNNAVRNPLHKNQGKLLTLQAFLELAEKKVSLGVLIAIQNAAFYASKVGFSVIDVVKDALNKSAFNMDTDRHVMILADESSVLPKFNDFPKYEKVLGIMDVSNAPKDAIDEVKKYANSVYLTKTVITVSDEGSLIIRMNNITMEMRAANLTVYVGMLLNEYFFLPFDYCNDPYVEIATLLPYVDGFMTDYPATAVSFFNSPCSLIEDPLKNSAMHPIEPGALHKMANPELLLPADPPLPQLTPENVVYPPIPPVVARTISPTPSPSSSIADSATPLHKQFSHSTKAAAAANANGVAISLILFYFVSIG